MNRSKEFFYYHWNFVLLRSSVEITRSYVTFISLFIINYFKTSSNKFLTRRKHLPIIISSDRSSFSKQLLNIISLYIDVFLWNLVMWGRKWYRANTCPCHIPSKWQPIHHRFPCIDTYCKQRAQLKLYITFVPFLFYDPNVHWYINISGQCLSFFKTNWWL